MTTHTVLLRLTACWSRASLHSFSLYLLQLYLNTHTQLSHAVWYESKGSSPAGSMWLPRPKTHPAILTATCGAHHVITATILLYCSSALGALLHSMVEEGVQQRKMREDDSTCTLVLTWIQLEVSLSSSHFWSQRRRYSHNTGSWGLLQHLKLSANELDC